MNEAAREAYLYWRTSPATNGAVEELKHEIIALRQVLEKLLTPRPEGRTDAR